eukprot:gene16258-biopygen6751
MVVRLSHRFSLHYGSHCTMSLMGPRAAPQLARRKSGRKSGREKSGSLKKSGRNKAGRPEKIRTPRFPRPGFSIRPDFFGIVIELTKQPGSLFLVQDGFAAQRVRTEGVPESGRLQPDSAPPVQKKKKGPQHLILNSHCNSSNSAATATATAAVAAAAAAASNNNSGSGSSGSGSGIGSDSGNNGNHNKEQGQK